MWNTDDVRALAPLDRRQADLATLRTDAKVPPRPRAIATLEHDLLLLSAQEARRSKLLAALGKTRTAVDNLVVVKAAQGA